jgi:hypothetical protein
MNFTFQQKITMAMGFIGAATSAFGALNAIMTSTEALVGTVVLGFVSACLAVVATVTSSQGSQINNVLSMPGVERIDVNQHANQTLAQMAVNPVVDKIAPIQADIDKVTATAKGTS